ncbi:uncharacterized protein JN550_003367 [Neoarthrinium moseri]|uniref:uncharacterized protein n=1 Tax=Neoarthrinium moseri TaxID=1658444 RepID=UPI001FDD9D8A|nr:uncharacterized protein JN550_003367 [Neoarthrinium moseri]KAI1873114.1 hypothetical protein JN550_003367 [Neoarthrinium moseri]
MDITSECSAPNDLLAGHSDNDDEFRTSQTITSDPSRQSSWIVPRGRERTEIPERSTIRDQDDARWREVVDMFGHLSKDTANIQSILQELHKGMDGQLASKPDILRTQNELEEAKSSLEEVHKKWKKTALELNQLRSQGTRPYQLLDADLERSVQGLRYEIRNISCSFQFSAFRLPEHFLQPQSNGLEKCMVEAMEQFYANHGNRISENMGPAIVQSFLWRILVSEVSERFRWAPELQSSITDVYNFLQPDYVYHSERGIPSGTEAQRKFQVWKADTSALILESMNNEDRDKCLQQVDTFTRDLSTQILDILQPFALGSDKISDQLGLIINDFISLDKEICRQVTRVDWLFHSLQHPLQFNPEIMTAIGAEIAPQSGQHIDLIVAPGLKKRGRHTGEDFGSEHLLLKMDVICIPSSRGRVSKRQCF